MCIRDSIHGEGPEFGLAGWDIGLSANGTILAIIAENNNGNGGYQRGSTRVYVWNEATNDWVQMGQDVDGEADRDDLRAIALSNDGLTFITHAYLNDGADGTTITAGGARVYKWDPSTTPSPWFDGDANALVGGNTPGAWVQMGQDINGEAAGDGQDNAHGRRSVDISADGNVVVIGGPYNDVEGAFNNAGHVRVHVWDPNATPAPWWSNEQGAYVNASQPGAWVQRGPDIDGEHDHEVCGRAVALNHDGSIVAFGCPYYPHPGFSGGGYGRVLVYEWSGSAWDLRDELVGPRGSAHGHSLGTVSYTHLTLPTKA